MTKSHNIEEFLEVLSSSSPTPGGGGASALVGAIGVSLGHMVGALTSGKKKYEHVQGEIDLLLKHADDLSKSLTGCLQQAASVPLRIMQLAAQAIEIQREFAIVGSPLVISDAATGVALCRASLMGALVNVKVNTKLMKDRCYADMINAEADALAEQYCKLSEEIFYNILERF